MNQAKTDVQHMTPVWQEIWEMIGGEAAQKLFTARAGTRIYIPQKPTVGDPLTELLGWEATVKLCKHWGSDYIDLPRNAALGRWLRNKQIISDYNAGQSVRSIALRLQTTERNVYRILGDPRFA